jgi:hypothetical protein
VYQSRVESREVESPTNLAADEPLSGSIPLELSIGHLGRNPKTSGD